jgi:hypothetical protein
LEGELADAGWIRPYSPEPIQQEHSAEQDTKGDPEVKVGCNGAIQVSVSFASVRQYCGLTVEDLGKNAKAILGMEGAAVNVQRGICVCDVEMYTLEAQLR